MEPAVWTVDQAATKLGDEDGSLRAKLVAHLSNGKGIVVFENHDLGHPSLGHALAFTYGTPEAQFEGGVDTLPEFCPDGLAKEITGGINYRYVRVAVVPPQKGE